MKRRTWALGGSIIAVAGLAAGSVVAFGPDGQHSAESLPPAGHTAVCGFEGSLVHKITADRPNDAEPFTPDHWRVDQDGDRGVWGITANATEILIEREGPDGQTLLERFSHDGRSQGSTELEYERGQVPHSTGPPALTPDGTVYAIDTYEGRRRVVRLTADGEVAAAFPLPASEETTGHPLDLQGVHWVAELDGDPALLVGEGEHTVHAMREDGDYLGVLPDLPNTVLAAVGPSSVAGLEASEQTRTLQVHDLATGSLALHAPYERGEQRSAVTTPPGIDGLRGLAPGPDGEGFLLASSRGIEWVDGDGVRLGLWMNGSGGMSLAESGGLAEHDGRYWVLTYTEGEHRVLPLTGSQMRAMLSEPVDPTAWKESELAQLGIGIGPVTDVPFHHFNAGDTPAVHIETAAGWGVREGENADLELHYTVTGDPTLADPVSQRPRRAQIPFGGGRTALHLPDTRPGAYEVSLWLTRPDSPEPLSGACLRYSISPDAAPLDLAGLSSGTDWGGPEPLRGVELAAMLGVGSHRVQLDFGALVPEPESDPDGSRIAWENLPGAQGETDGDAFAQLREAGRQAERQDVDLIVQVGMNGEAEQAAVRAGTWAGWSEEIVAAFARHVPEVRYWSAWNEPNFTYGGQEYARDVEIPFARAAHEANPQAQVLGGNSLGFAYDWWESVVTTDVCEHVDAVGVHPYTGWNRSWEEEGFTLPGEGFEMLREVLGPDCGTLPVWDTETGWTSDGVLSSWAQASNVARKLLWYGRDDVAGWTYFFSEGGWGENELSWSLIQHHSHVKPGALAFATVSRLLEQAGPPRPVQVPVPFTHAMRFSGSQEVLAVWTDSMRTGAVVRTDAEELTVVDQYGHRRTLPVDDGRAAVTLTGAPQFLLAPAGSSIDLAAEEEFGADVLRGAQVRASSTHEEADPQTLTAGSVNPHRPWRSGRLAGDEIDEHPHVDVILDRATTINRIAVAGGSIVCCETGLRNYTVSVRTTSGAWVPVARVQDQFWDRVVLVEFDPVEATAVRIEVPWRSVRGERVLDVNYSDFAGGNPPPFMGLRTESDYIVSIAAISAWAPGS